MFYRKELEIAILTSGAEVAPQESVAVTRDRLQISDISLSAGTPCFGLYLLVPLLCLQL